MRHKSFLLVTEDLSCERLGYMYWTCSGELRIISTSLLVNTGLVTECSTSFTWPWCHSCHV